MKHNISNPKNKVYFLCYGKPRNVGDISNIMYGKRNSKVSVWITELLNDKWIEPYYPNKKDTFDMDRRKNYYIATPKGLYENIISELKRQNVNGLNRTQQKQLKKYLDSDKLRQSFTGNIDSFVHSDDIFSIVFDVIGHEFIFSEVITKYAKKIYDNELSKIMPEVEEGEEITNNIFESPITDMDLIIKLQYLNFNHIYLKQYFESSIELIEEIKQLEIDHLKEYIEKLKKKK